MKRGEQIILIFCLVLVALIVYYPHYSSPYPIHTDEWHHISEALKLVEGQYVQGIGTFEVGFHIFLAFFSIFFDLVLFYKFFPAIWAVLTCIILFFITYSKTKSYWTAIFSILFYASIRANINLGGIWFFTPLVFSIPFIYLYFFFFSEWVEKGKQKYLWFCLLSMSVLLFTHIISLTFAFLIFLIYSAIHYKFFIKKWKFFLSFVLIFIVALLFYKFNLLISFQNLFFSIVDAISFEYGWGVSEYNNSFLEIYSFGGYIFALIGFLVLARKRKDMIYLIWPTVCLALILSFKLIEVSFFAPYQRMLYYFVISLPFLSAVGLQTVSKKILASLKKLRIGHNFALIFLILFFVLVAFSLYVGYSYENEKYPLYSPVDQNSYEALSFLKNFSYGKVLANPFISQAVYPIARKEPYSSLYFDNSERANVSISILFYANCTEQKDFIKKNNISYLVLNKELSCGFKEIYSKEYHIYSFV